MKLEVGMYVRTLTLSGISRIGKLEKIDDICITDNGAVDKNQIIKVSHNIIDLIEVRDYVNGMQVTRISGTRYDDNDLHCYCEHNGNENWKQVMIPAKDIKSIVTKEQFESMIYKLED